MNAFAIKNILRVLLRSFISVLAIISSVQFLFASTNVGGRISTNTTWTLAGSPYIVTSSVSVYGTPTQTVKLTIEPGVQVKFNANYYIQISSGTNKGALYAVGTAGSPIVFTSNKPSPARGDWDSIKYYDATDDALSALAYCTVEYGGSSSSNGSIYIEKAAPPITNCTVRYSKYDGIRCNNASPQITGGSINNNNTNGIYASGQSLFTINGTSFSGNGSYAISVGANDEIFSTQGITAAAGDRVEIRSGTVGRDQSWRNLGIPYRITTGNITVQKDATTAAKLTIEPGVQVRFNGNYSIQIGMGTYKGALYAVGTENNPILFTSDKTTPQPGDWYGIQFNDASDDTLTQMTYCTVEYGGSSSSTGMVNIDKAAPTLTNCTIRYSKYIGIRCNNASPTITGGSIVNNNTNGIYALGQTLFTINGTSFSGNGSYAISVGANDEIFSTQGITAAAGDRVEIRGGTVGRDQSWRNLGIPYRITGSIVVQKDSTTAAKLTIEPGVQIRFNANYSISIGMGTNKGALSAVGTENNPILFTSDKTTPQPGDWNGIQFNDASDDTLTQMTYCTVEYGGSSSTIGSVNIDKAAPTLTNCTIRYSKYIGIRCNNASPTITGGSIVNNNTNGIYALGQTLFTINGTSFSGNGSYAISVGANDEIFSTQGITAAAGDRVEIRSGTVGRDQSWRNLGIPYRITGSIVVQKDSTTAAKLTIEPGVQIRFNANYSISIGMGTNKGALSAVGTESNPILFTSDKTTPQPGDWNGIQFNDASDDTLTRMTYCTVEYGGSSSTIGCVGIGTAAPTLTNCIIRYSKYNGIYASGQSSFTINGTSFSGNGSYAISVGANDEIFSTQGITAAAGDGVEIRSGTVGRDLSWRNLGVPYRITGDISVYKDSLTAAKLTIEPGVQAKFSGNYRILVGNFSFLGPEKGALYAVGTENNPILFTSDKQTPQPGDWNAIIFNDTTDDVLTEMKYCTIEYGGSNSSNGSLYIEKSNIKVANCTVKYSKTDGIRCSYSNPTFKFCTISNNNNGIYSSNSEPQLNYCNIFANSQYGVFNSQSMIIDARFNWWGHSSGPSGLGPGTGDRITTLVVYETWLCLMYSYPYYISEGISTTKQLNPSGGLTYFYAKSDDDSNWTIVIKNASQQIVKSFSESGKKIRQAWDGKDQNSQPLPAGSYSYQIQAQRQSDLSEATPLLGEISIDLDYPIGFISSPLPGDFIAGTISIIGNASGPNFREYKLEYGTKPVPSTWVEIKRSTTPVENGELGFLDISNLDVSYVTFKLTVNNNYPDPSITIFTCNLSAFDINASPNPFSPNSDGKKDTTTVSAQFIIESNWILEIKDSSGQNIIRTYAGSGTNMSQEWDGKNESGEIQAHGIYPFVLHVSNPALPEPSIVNGTIILDINPPTAQITEPIEDELFSNIYGGAGAFTTEIFGTASDEYFDSYILEYGETYNPTSWNLITDIKWPAHNEYMGQFNNSQLSGGVYTIRLTVFDKASNQSSAIVHIRVGHLRIFLSSHQLNTAQSNSVAITTELPFDVTETIIIKDKNKNIRKTIIAGLPRNGGIYNDNWDGKDDSGITLPHSTYFVIVTVVTQDQRYFTLDLSETGGVRRPPIDEDASEFHLFFPSSFSPYKGEEAEITFDLDEPSLVSLYAKENLENGRERNLLKKEPLALGSYTIYWDGTDDNGAFLDYSMTSLNNLIVFWVYSLADNCVVIFGERPEITSLSANPIYFSPVDKEFVNGLEISYSISKASNVNISIQNNQGNIVKTMNLGTQSAGLHTIYWDGRANNGDLADSGSYRIGVELTDLLGNTSLIRFCLMVLFY